jgi:tripartite-type tricarboxylate transporter receptor subunit TctC
MLKALFAGCVVACLGAATVAAQSNYPNRPVRIVVPTAPGGGVDTVARLYAQHMSKATGQQFYVENRPGAGNILGIESVARSDPDGYTLLLGAATITINHVIYAKLPYDVMRDMQPITNMVSLPNIIVGHSSLEPNTLQEYIALAKAKPNAINYASAGHGSNLHLAMELLKHRTGIEVLHVPYKGVGPAVKDLAAGHVMSMVSNILSTKALIEAGRLKSYAVTSIKRSSAMPNVPTVAESGVPGYEVLNWFGLFAPAGTPAPVVDMLHREAVAMMKIDEIRKRLSSEGADPVVDTPAAFTAFVKAEMQKWSELAKAANIKPRQ